jgi:radical SAM superfamily enzyme
LEDAAMKFVESVKYVSRKFLVFSFLLSLLLVTGVWADSRVDTVINSTWKFNKTDVATAIETESTLVDQPKGKELESR